MHSFRPNCESWRMLPVSPFRSYARRKNFWKTKMSKTTDIQMAKPTGDVVLQEIWRIKDTLSASYGHDVKRLFAEARERQKLSGHAIVNLQTKRRKG